MLDTIVCTLLDTMASNEESDEVDLGEGLYPLLIIQEGDEPSGDTQTRHKYPPRGRARGRFGAQQRSRGRGQGRNSTETSGNENSNRISERGRGRARDRRPQRSNHRGSRYQSSDRRYENKDSRIMERDDSRAFSTGEDRAPTATVERVKKLSISKLIDLSKWKDEPDKLLLEVDKISVGFLNILKTQLDPDTVYFVIRILSIISRSSQTAHLRNILREVESDMLNNLTVLIYEISMKDHRFENIWNMPNKAEKFLLNIITVVRVVMTILNPSLGKCINLITAISKVRENLSLDNIDTELKDIESLFEKVKANKEVKETKQKSARSSVEKMTEPPSPFREIPIFPELNDLQMDERPFLRANKVQGKYENLDTYLDIQFRLLREDYIQPLRKGISEYRNCILSGGNVGKIRELKLYNSVKIMYPVCSGRGINHVIQFDTSKFKTMRWASSRRLLHGSLLCLSDDNFETILYATVTGREETQLKNGKLEVHFENTDDRFENYRNKTFVMAETSAYFEAYRFILKGLQEIESSMPFERYLVNCETTLKPPAYLLSAGGPHYDFSKLLLTECESNHFPVLNTRQWPKASDLGLDRSQYEAIQRAVTKELAIIQGPPGTGKTFVGLKIAQLLLDNQRVWRKDGVSAQTEEDKRTKSRKYEGPPVLVVCYTNHALDQFLEGLINMGKTKMVRIGGRCKNEVVEPYVLRNVKHQRKESGKGFSRLSENNAQCRRELKECEEEIERSNSQMKKTETKILPYRTLMHFMTEAQQDSFESSHSEEDLHTCLENWLNVHKSQQWDKPLSQEEQVHVAWREFVMKEVSPMPDNDRQDVSDIMNLEPLQRAELYKAWVAELVSNIQALMDQYRSEKGKHLEINELQGVLLKAETCILDARLLNSLVSRPDTKRQLTILSKKYKESPDKLVWHWLCLSLPTLRLKAILEEIVDRDSNSNSNDIDDTIDTEDMEEDRELDEEEEYLSGLKTKAKKAQVSFEKNEDEWFEILNEKSYSNKIRQILMSAKTLTRKEAEKLTHVWDLPDQTRKTLYAFWVESFRRYLKESVKKYEILFNEATEKLEEVRNMETVELLNDSEVVAMTTTGAAKYRNILQTIRPRIIIVEEAAEVLESHIVTTLNENCQHLILIGDHKQLRPSTTVYALAKKYHMDISLFERMVSNSVPCVTLEEQHRMRPEISVLLKHESLYPKLRDHCSVHEYEDVKGIDESFQFITHEEEEFTSAESTSYSNPHEAKYLARLCRYLISQGYRRDQITVITPYMGQVLLLRKEMPKSDFEGVRITAVDNFQGEENDIILLSLVRSKVVENKSQQRNPIGFVGIENRICVSLSRAKMGLYVIGNFRLLEEYSDMWARMIRLMKQKRLVREGLRLRCQNHPDTITFAQSIADFKNVPEGGCTLSCNAKLICGHICPKNCHPIDKDHQSFMCYQPCQQIICNNNHKCTKYCYQPCGQCNTVVEKLIPMCGHAASMACHFDPFKWKCSKKCKSVLQCGHSCNRKCSECTEEGHHEKECNFIVERTLECGHKASMKCHDDLTTIDCKVACEALLDCNHKCSGNCGWCFGGKIHKGCAESCGKILPCGHKCSSPCSEICPPCTRPCEFECSHRNKCKNKCFEKCTPCFGPCKVNCVKHKIKCTRDCSEKCDIEPCTEPCNKRLNCKEGHGNCRGICGERCFCIICQKNKLRLEPGETVKEGMIFIQMQNCYCIIEIDRARRYINKEQDYGDKLFYKRCPHCCTAITKHMRPFTNILKTTRESIVHEYEKLVGTVEKRRAKIVRLKQDFRLLIKKGLTSEEVDRVMGKLQVNNFGALQYTEDMKIRLIKLLQICDLMGKSKSTVSSAVDHAEGIVKISKLRDMLLRGKRFVTMQFWQDVDRELKRLLMWIRFYSLNERIELTGMDTSEIADIITMAFSIISRKDYSQADETCLSDVYKNTLSAVKEKRFTCFSELKSMLDDYLNDSVDSEEAQNTLEPEAARMLDDNLIYSVGSDEAQDTI